MSRESTFFSDTLPLGLVPKARGSRSNAAGRFERLARETFLDGWDSEAEARTLGTTTVDERPKKVITRNDSPDIPFDRSVNPYRGCEHGCSYCFARPSHAYLGLSPGLDFETRLTRKLGAAEVLARELAAKSYEVAPIAIGTNTDPYQPIEARDRIMRAILEVLRDHNHPVTITTKGTLIERDIDLLRPMAAKGLASVGMSVTSLGSRLSRQMEPRAPAPARRLKTIRALSEAGIPVRVMAAPMIPALTDHELEAILAAAAQHGARAAGYIMLRLPREVAPLFEEWLAAHVPDRAGRVMKRMRELHGGEVYDSRWGKRMTGEGEWAELMARRFDIALARSGLARKMPPLRTDLFAVPPRPGDQLSLF
ncbi:PA0069 family radical SAM protein [Celeribacter indicus]|uniref:Radical SAM domain-containing protein n=1 Tax=Celeribacter indicus TaxID=1208324 RepID=A0A0B5E0B8_9RHOB|nr:PA0069 family radical SAM protein [Celeribacter indicus]AJE46446.1 radical SAM domain-containing protein [Celeribacter indicus]SDW56913.1 DNA repair photolyase [Celeribacter indicus]